LPLTARRRRAVGRLAIIAATAIASLAGTTAAASAAPTYDDYVALGDSWTADVVLLGPPTGQYVTAGCVQSSRNYPKLVAAALDVPSFFDASCGGAESDHFAEPQAAPLGGTNAPQLSHLTKNTDLVTIGIGGNDIGLATALVGCINLLPSLTVVPGVTLPAPLGGSCKAKFTADGIDQISENIKAEEPKILERVRAVKPLVAPDAQIFMVNYMQGLPKAGCWPYVQVNNEDMPWLYDKLNELNAMVARIARKAGYQLIDTWKPTAGHDMCQSPLVRYVEGVLPVSLNGPAIAVPFHPNSAGAEAQAQIVLKAVRSASAQPDADS